MSKIESSPFEKAVSAWLFQLPGIWTPRSIFQLTQTQEKALDRLIYGGFIEARITTRLTVKGEASPLKVRWRISGNSKRLWGEKVGQYLASKGHLGKETSIFTGDYEELRLTADGEQAKQDFSGTVAIETSFRSDGTVSEKRAPGVDANLFRLVTGGPDGSNGCVGDPLVELDEEEAPSPRPNTDTEKPISSDTVIALINRHNKDLIQYLRDAGDFLDSKAVKPGHWPEARAELTSLLARLDRGLGQSNSPATPNDIISVDDIRKRIKSAHDEVARICISVSPIINSAPILNWMQRVESIPEEQEVNLQSNIPIPTQQGQITLARIWELHPDLEDAARDRIRKNLDNAVKRKPKLGGKQLNPSKEWENTYDAQLASDAVAKDRTKHGK